MNTRAFRGILDPGFSAAGNAGPSDVAALRAEHPKKACARCSRPGVVVRINRGKVTALCRAHADGANRAETMDAKLRRARVQAMAEQLRRAETSRRIGSR